MHCAALALLVIIRAVVSSPTAVREKAKKASRTIRTEIMKSSTSGDATTPFNTETVADSAKPKLLPIIRGK
jgi:hypothetical protein